MGSPIFNFLFLLFNSPTLDTIQKYFSDFSEKQLAQLEALKGLYSDWNEKINVISRKDMDQFYTNHVLHSLSITTQFQFTKDMEVMDLGTGGGFPGIPLAIFFPETNFHLVDSINKKLKIVQDVAEQIGLSNVTIQHTRAEEIKDRKFDVITSRAVAPLKELWQWSKPMLRKNKSEDKSLPNGLICLKGGDLSKEIFESGCKPFVWEVEKIFQEPYFEQKYMLYQKL